MSEQIEQNETQLGRREMLVRIGVLGAGAAACAATATGAGFLTGFFDRLKGVTHTELLPAQAWRFEDGVLSVALDQTTLLDEVATAVRVEGETLPNRVLIVHSNDGGYYAYRNECPHGGRHIDLVANGERLRCTSLGMSTFEVDGSYVSGSVQSPLATYPVTVEGDRLTITL